jgi:hypothetical protein
MICLLTSVTFFDVMSYGGRYLPALTDV